MVANDVRHTERVVIVGHHIGKRIGYISTSNNFLCFPRLVRQLLGGELRGAVQAVLTYQKEGEDDAAYEKPFSSIEWNEKTSVDVLALLENFVGPIIRRQHGDG